MHILITGGAGYVGSGLVHRLLLAGHRVRVLDRLLFGGQALLGVLHEEDFELQVGDLRDPETVATAVKGVDAVVHLAAIVGDPACVRDPELSQSTNRDGSRLLWEAAAGAGVQRFIFASTCSNYGRLEDPTAAITEGGELRPISLYAETKVEFEKHLLEATASSGPVPTVLRFSTVYGLSPRMRFDLTVNEFTMELFLHRRLEVYGEQYWRPYVHVRDAARAVEAALTADTAVAGGRVYNVGDDRENFQKGTLVEMIREQLEDPVEITYVQKREDPRDYKVSFGRIAEELNFHITRRVKDGIAEIRDALAQGLFRGQDLKMMRN